MFISLPYILVLLILVYCYLNEVKLVHNISPNQARNISFFILLLFVGLRGFVSTDFVVYYPWFNDLENIFKLDYGTLFISSNKPIYEVHFEFGFVFFSSLIKTIFPNYHIWIFINTVFDLILLKACFKRYCNSQILCFIIFVAFNGLSIEFNLLRNSKAIVLFLFSIQYIHQKRFLPYMLVNLIGCTFHTSALLYIPIYFVLNIRTTKFFRYAFIIIMVLLQVLRVDIFSPITNTFLQLDSSNGLSNDKLNFYIQESTEYGFTFGYFERLLSLFFFTFFYSALIQKNSYNVIFYNIYLIYYFLFQVLSNNAILVSRIPVLFVISYAILYPNICELKFRYRRIFILGICMLCMVKVYLETEGHHIYIYDNIITGIQNYNSKVQFLRYHGHGY